MAGKEDRRVQRTRQLLREALFSLVQEKGFEALTVQEIIDRANIGRATFYAHFDNKDDLLVSGLEDLRASLQQRQREALSRSNKVNERVFAFSYQMFSHANGHRKLFQAMVGKRGGAAVQRVLHRVIVELMQGEVKAAMPLSVTRSVPTEPLVQFLAGAFFGLLMWWLDGKTRLPVEDVDALFRQLAVPALKAALSEE